MKKGLRGKLASLEKKRNFSKESKELQFRGGGRRIKGVIEGKGTQHFIGIWESRRSGSLPGKGGVGEKRF